MRHPHDRSPDRRRLLPIATINAAQDRVLALTGLALAFVVLLSVARCSSAAVSTLDAEVDPLGPARAAAQGRVVPGADGEEVILRPRPVRPVDAADDGAGAAPDGEGNGGDGAGGAGGASSPPLTFVAPPRQGLPAAGAEPAGVGGAAPAAEVGGTVAPAGGAGGGGPAGGGSANELQLRLTQLTETTGGWFQPDSTQVGGGARPVLDQVAELLRQQPGARVEIGGHTDTNGTPETNQRLSLTRAEAVRDELVARGVAAERLQANGYGQTRPRSPNDTVAGRASNRRIELTVLAA